MVLDKALNNLYYIIASFAMVKMEPNYPSITWHIKVLRNCCQHGDIMLDGKLMNLFVGGLYIPIEHNFLVLQACSSFFEACPQVLVVEYC